MLTNARVSLHKICLQVSICCSKISRYFSELIPLSQKSQLPHPRTLLWPHRAVTSGLVADPVQSISTPTKNSRILISLANKRNFHNAVVYLKHLQAQKPQGCFAERFTYDLFLFSFLLHIVLNCICESKYVSLYLREIRHSWLFLINTLGFFWLELVFLFSFMLSFIHWSFRIYQWNDVFPCYRQTHNERQ